MPHITSIIDNSGPVVTVHIGVSVQRQNALKAAQLEIPAYVPCNLLIDTGASGTCIDGKIISTLSLVPTGSVAMLTPSTGTVPHSVNTYDISMVIQGNGHPKVLAALPVMECNFDSQPIDGLLGRDILSTARLIYSGTDNIVMLSIL